MGQKLAVTHDILFFAFKYNLGGNSEAPEIVMDPIKENIRHIEDYDLREYIREIYEYRNSGMLTNEAKWLDFVDYLQEELRSRE